MTKKDYELIAKGIKPLVDYNRIASRRMTASEEYRMLHVDCLLEDKSIAWNIATLLQDDNPQFNRQKFLTACGIED